MSESTPIGYSFPAQFTTNYVAMLKEALNSADNANNDFIHDIYGSTPFSTIGHSRFPWDVPDISMEILENYVAELRRIGIPARSEIIFKSEPITGMKPLCGQSCAGAHFTKPRTFIEKKPRLAMIMA